jgi:CBS domain-containing protein
MQLPSPERQLVGHGFPSTLLIGSRRCEHGGVTNIPRAGSTPISTITGDPVKRIAVDATVADVAKALVAGDVGVIVVGDDARPAALMSERDVVRVVATGKDPAAVRAVDVASTKLVWCGAEVTVDEAAVRMMDSYIRHILVEEDGALIGIVSARDLLGVYCAEADTDFGTA